MTLAKHLARECPFSIRDVYDLLVDVGDDEQLARQCINCGLINNWRPSLAAKALGLNPRRIEDEP